MSEIILLLLILLLILNIYFIFLISKIRNNDNDKRISEIREKMIELEARLVSKIEPFPDIISTRTGDIIQQRFLEFTDNIAGKNQEMLKQFGEFRNTLTESLAENSKKLNVEFYEFSEKVEKQSREMIEKFGTLQNELTSALGSNSKKTAEDLAGFKDSLKKGINDDFEKLNHLVEEKLDNINRRVQENLNEGFNKTNETFNNVIQRLAKIDEAQKNIESLSGNVVSLQDILTDKKSRGIFGEIQLNQILYSVFGEKNDKVFSIQYKLSNGNAVDAILFAPEPTGNIPIDSKFPLENFKRMTDRELSDIERKNYARLFENDVKKHISDIAGKYIIPGETSHHAVMFLPAEAIFAEINAYHPQIVNYAQQNNVWITSPTTFMAVLSTLQLVLNNLEREKYAGIIQDELRKLSKEFDRYRDRWTKLSTHLSTVGKDVKDIHTTTDKISKSFEKIAKVDLDDKKLLK